MRKASKTGDDPLVGTITDHGCWSYLNALQVHHLLELAKDTQTIVSQTAREAGQTVIEAGKTVKEASKEAGQTVIGAGKTMKEASKEAGQTVIEAGKTVKEAITPSRPKARPPVANLGNSGCSGHSSPEPEQRDLERVGSSPIGASRNRRPAISRGTQIDSGT